MWFFRICSAMCMLCDQALQVNRRVDGRALYGLSIAPVELIDDDNVATTRHLTATDGVLDYYLHAQGGSVNVSGGGVLESRKYNPLLSLNLTKDTSNLWFAGLMASSILIFVKLTMY